MGTSSKRKKELEDGETWRAKNVSRTFYLSRLGLISATAKSLTITSTRSSPCCNVSAGVRGRASYWNAAWYSEEIRHSSAKEANGRLESSKRGWDQYGRTRRLRTVCPIHSLAPA